MNERFNLQLFAEDGADAGTGSGDAGTAGTDSGSGNEGGLPGTNTVLGGDAQGSAPQVPEAYDFSGAVKEVFGDTGSLDEEVATQFTELLKGVNATQEQADAMAKFGMQYAQGLGEAITAQIQQSYVDEVSGWADAARKELGNAFDDTVAKACTTRNYLEQHVPGFTKMLNLTGAGNHVAMMKAMAAMASLVGEDRGMGNSGSGGVPGNTLYPNTDWSKY